VEFHLGNFGVNAMNEARKVVLHAGCGSAILPEVRFPAAEWREIRLDIDAGHRPDVVGSLTDMGGIESNSVDAVYSSHNLEHLHAHEVPVAMREFLRVLRPGGVAVIVVPDLQVAGEILAADRGEETLWYSEGEPLTAMDMIYGHGKPIAAGNLYQMHKTGFTASSLGRALGRAGFSAGQVARGNWQIHYEALKAP
jgi:predicted SAM-dependent methyltransferase